MNPILKSKNFNLAILKGVGTNDTPYTKLDVESTGAARKHVVSIDLDSKWEDFKGKPIQYKYYNVRVSHGMRMKTDTLDETLEYVDVLKEAVDFAKDVMKWIDKHPSWKA